MNIFSADNEKFSAWDEGYDPFDKYKGDFLKQLQEIKDDKRMLISVSETMERRVKVADKSFSDQDIRETWYRRSFDTRDAIVHLTAPERKAKLVLDAFHSLDLSNARVRRGAIELPQEYWEKFTGPTVLELSKKEAKYLSEVVYDVQSAKQSEVWQFLSRNKKILGEYVDVLIEHLVERGFGNDCGIMRHNLPFSPIDNVTPGVITMRPLNLRHFEAIGHEAALTYSNIGKNDLFIAITPFSLDAFLRQCKGWAQGRVPPEKLDIYTRDAEKLYHKWLEKV